MSIKIINDVFDNSEMRGNDRLVMIAIADNANTENRRGWPSVREISRKTRIPIRTVWRCIKRCVASGELRIVKSGTHEGESNLYEVLVKRSSPQPTDKVAGVPNGDTPMPCTGTPPMPPSGTLTVREPSIEPSVPRGELKELVKIGNKFTDSKRLVDMWDKWVRHRMKLKRPTNGWDEFFLEQATWLGKFEEPIAFSILQKSVINGYQGLFEPRGHTPTGRSVFELKTIIEAKRQMADSLKKGCSYEVATGRKWRTKEDQVKYADLVREIEEMNSQLSKM